MRTTIATILLLLFSTVIFAQEVEVPANATFDTEADYRNYEPNVLELTNWYLTTPLGTDFKKREEVNNFLRQWITGSPYLSVSLYMEFLAYAGDCPECLMAFMNGWVRYSLQNNYSDSVEDCAVAGLTAVVKFYEINKDGLGKISEIEKLKKKLDKDKLRSFVQGVITQ